MFVLSADNSASRLSYACIACCCNLLEHPDQVQIRSRAQTNLIPLTQIAWRTKHGLGCHAGCVAGRVECTREGLRGPYGAAGTGRRAGTSLFLSNPDRLQIRSRAQTKLIPFAQIVWRTKHGLGCHAGCVASRAECTREGLMCCWDGCPGNSGSWKVHRRCHGMFLQSEAGTGGSGPPFDHSYSPAGKVPCIYLYIVG